MRYDDDARLDTSEVTDQRGRGGSGGFGGGGLGGLLPLLLGLLFRGTSAQRKRWLSTGFTSGDPTRCDTRTNDLG